MLPFTQAKKPKRVVASKVAIIAKVAKRAARKMTAITKVAKKAARKVAANAKVAKKAAKKMPARTSLLDCRWCEADLLQ